jgi:uncharacterized protein YcgL (UPF0745 family)
MRVFAFLALGLLAPAPTVAVLPAIKKVVTMLDNLVTMMDSEGAEDEKKVAHFVQFCDGEKSAANAKISEMQTKIEDTNAALVDLGSQKQELDATVAKLNGQIDTETSQINDATEKRKAENAAFTKEQIDFENAIAACGKAVTLLASHYGSGETTPAAKPDYLSLLATIRKSVDNLRTSSRHATLVVNANRSLQMLQQPNNNVYQESSEESGNIVDQIKLLSSTFAEDKMSAVDEEARLQKSFDNLIGKKNQLLSSLILERDTQQADLNSVNQNIAEQSSALKMAEDTLADQQTLLASVTKQQSQAEEMFKVRKADREAELAAVKKGLEILEKVSFVQSDNVESDGGKVLLTLRKRQPMTPCQQCARVAAMLRQKSTVYHSSVLAAAAATSMGSDAIGDVINNLKDLITRIDQEQKTEKEHKDWCEQETGLTTAKREDHSGVVTQLTGIMADLKEVIKEKDLALDENAENIHDEDDYFDEQVEMRSEAKGEFEEDLQDHLDAIQALNEAIEILANFYAKRNAKLIQTPAVGRPIKQSFLQKSMQPSGGKAVQVMSEIRGEFEHAKGNLESDEKEAVETFTVLKEQHMKTDSDLHVDKNTITVEEQTAEQQLDTAEHDKENNEGEVAAADQYLNQLGKSCYPLMMHFDERTRLRKEEKEAIKDAIKVLRNA